MQVLPALEERLKQTFLSKVGRREAWAIYQRKCLWGAFLERESVSTPSSIFGRNVSFDNKKGLSAWGERTLVRKSAHREGTKGDSTNYRAVLRGPPFSGHGSGVSVHEAGQILLGAGWRGGGPTPTDFRKRLSPTGHPPEKRGGVSYKTERSQRRQGGWEKNLKQRDAFISFRRGPASEQVVQTRKGPSGKAMS